SCPRYNDTATAITIIVVILQLLTTTTTTSINFSRLLKDNPSLLNERNHVAIMKGTHTRTVRSCARSPSGKMMTTASFDATTDVLENIGGDYECVSTLEPSCSAEGCHPTTPQTAISFFPLYLVALGFGATEPCFTSFGADQFVETDDKERNKNSSFFNWLYFTSKVGALLGSSLLKPGGSPLTRIAQVLIAAFRKINVKVPEEENLLYETADAESSIKGSRKLEYTPKLRCFDKAAVPIDTDEISTTTPWRLCTVTQVEELEAVVRLLPIWATVIVFSAVYSHMSTLFVLQGNTVCGRLAVKMFAAAKMQSITPVNLQNFDISADITFLYIVNDETRK
ncbi:hypothetical protein KSS87_000181, partial [Heliosperma pusillum]